jgi:ATP/maltotriose-dependent transcriptional regulator MalT
MANERFYPVPVRDATLEDAEEAPVSEVESPLDRARGLHREARWAEACAAFVTGDRAGGLDVDDLELLAEAAQLTGRHDDAVAALERAYAVRAQQRDVDAAARACFWMWQAFVLDGEMARAGGWMARLSALADECSAEPGWLLVMTAYGCIGAGRYDEAEVVLARALSGSRARGDADLDAFALLLTGRARLQAGHVRDGLARFDRAMLSVVGGQTSPRVTSLLFCAAIANYEEGAHDLAGAQEWARALERWMSALPSPLVGPFLANCRVYRAVLMRRRGEWEQARLELEAAVAELTGVHGALLAGSACYQLAESHRLLGDHDAAERAYRQASGLGASTQPGLALLRLTQGDVPTAAAGLRRALTEAEHDRTRCLLLPAFVTVMIAAGALPDAADGVAELGRIADEFDTTLARTEHARALGELDLAHGSAAAALPSLRRAALGWRELAAPYETASTAGLVAAACRAVGDEEAAQLELESARDTYRRLGASRDVDTVQAFMSRPAERLAGGLTARELEVLRLVAQAKTNRQIATELLLSERTVHRHISNIFAKLDVRSRTQAATYAVERGLVRRTGR